MEVSGFRRVSFLTEGSTGTGRQWCKHNQGAYICLLWQYFKHVFKGVAAHDSRRIRFRHLAHEKLGGNRAPPLGGLRAVAALRAPWRQADDSSCYLISRVVWKAICGHSSMIRESFHSLVERMARQSSPS